MAVYNSYRFPFASFPAVRLVLLVACGITLDFQLGLSPGHWILFFATTAILYITSEFFYRRLLVTQFYNITILGYLCLTASFGGLWHSFLDYQEEPLSAKIINTYTWERLTFEGDIRQIKQTDSGGVRLDIRVDTTVFTGGQRWGQSYNIRAVWKPKNNAEPQKLKLGDRLTFLATVYPLEPKRNPLQFDYKQYLASNGIYSQVGIQELLAVEENDGWLSWNSLRQKVLEAINNNFSRETTSLAQALLIGYKNDLDREDKIAFSRAGLSHIMAVSGLHVGFILAPFWICIPLFWTFRYGKQAGLILLVCLLFFYAGLTGFSASVIRASLAGGMLTYGKLFHKVRDSKNITAVAALVILLINPCDLFSIGFQLSFGAVYIILLTAPVITGLLPKWVRFRWYGQPLMVVIISFIVQLGLFPWLAYYFGEVSIVGPLANAVVVPLLGAIVPYALLLVALSNPFPGIANFLNVPADQFLYGLNSFVTFVAGLQWSWMQIQIESLLFFGAWIAAVFLIASFPIAKIRWKLLAIFLFMICINQAKILFTNLGPSKLRITFFDVGQGDAALVRTPHNKHFLIDTGRWQPGYNSAKYIIIPYLHSRGIKKLEGVFLSHPHADHIGGINDLIEQIPIDTIYNSGATYSSRLYKFYHRQAARKQVPIVSLTAGDKVNLDPAIRLLIYGPAAPHSVSNVNNHSLILELIYGETEFLFMGDAERTQEQQLVSRFPQLIQTDLLKVGHHGSKTSSTANFLQKTAPQIGLISLGRENQFNHPHRQATYRLRNNSADLFFTSLRGAVVFESEGFSILQKSWK